MARTFLLDVLALAALAWPSEVVAQGVKATVLSIGDGDTIRVRQAGEALKSAALAKFEATIATLGPASDKVILSQGQQVFTTYCAPCHRPDGGGLVGPNLCDDYWIHGSNYVDNVKIIINGVPDKGMLTWRGILKPGEVHAVASYIYQFRGTKPPNPKPREDQAPKQTGPSPFE